MQEIKYADAGMDMKKLALCFMGKMWMVLLAAALGAVLGGVLYGVARIVPESEREYQAVSKVYLDFAPDETGEVYQAYNGYTWNDLMATDPILDVTMSHLPEGYSREQVVAATKAEILSDVRLLTITVTTHDADSCNAILYATGQSLAERGNTAKEFEQIEVIRTQEAELVVADSRMKQAVLVGLVTAAALMLLGMMFCYVLDDRILVASDLKQVTDVSFIGYAGGAGRLCRDYEENLAYLRKKFGRISILVVTQGNVTGETDAQKSRAEGKRGRANRGEAIAEKSGSWQDLCDTDGVMILVDSGKVHAAYLAYVIEQLKVRECRLVGVAIGGADERFLSRYYGRAIGK